MPTDRTGRTAPRRSKRSHASAWILVAAVSTTGGALAVAAMHDPQGMRQHLDATLAEMKSMTGAVSTDTTTTAQADATAVTPERTPAQEFTPVTETKASVPGPNRSSDAPALTAAPAAGRSASEASPAPRLKQLAPPATSTNTSKELAENQPVNPDPLPSPPLPPVQPPAVEAPPAAAAPPAEQHADEAVPPPVQAPASSPQ